MEVGKKEIGEWKRNDLNADFGPPWRDYVDYLPPNQHATRETAFDHSFYKFGLGQGLQMADLKKDSESNSVFIISRKTERSDYIIIHSTFFIPYA